MRFLIFPGSYLFAQKHAAHIISFNFFNMGDRLYRNHLSFIKEFAPEMGRGLRVTYTVAVLFNEVRWLAARTASSPIAIRQISRKLQIL